MELEADSIALMVSDASALNSFTCRDPRNRIYGESRRQVETGEQRSRSAVVRGVGTPSDAAPSRDGGSEISLTPPPQPHNAMAVEALDTGWSWVVAFSCSYIHFALFGLFRSSGVMYVALLATYGATREEAAWPFSLCSAVFQLTAPLASVAANYVSVRKASLLGSVIATIGITCCFFADNVTWINIFYGVVHGVGFGFAVTLVPVIVNQYFIRHRATAIGIAFSGGTVSSFIFPVAMEYLLETYGLRGSFLVLGGIVMNTLVAASMLRTPPWLEKRKTRAVSNPPPQDVCARNELDSNAEMHILQKGLLFKSEEHNLKDKDSSSELIPSLHQSQVPYPCIPVDNSANSDTSEQVRSNNLKNSDGCRQSLTKNDGLVAIPCNQNESVIVSQENNISDGDSSSKFHSKYFNESKLSNSALAQVCDNDHDSHRLTYPGELFQLQAGGDSYMQRSRELHISPGGKDYSAEMTDDSVTCHKGRLSMNVNGSQKRCNSQEVADVENNVELLMVTEALCGPRTHFSDPAEFDPLSGQGLLPLKSDDQPWVEGDSTALLTSSKMAAVTPKSESSELRLMRGPSAKTGFSRFMKYDVCVAMVEILQTPMFHVLTFSMCIFFLLLHSFFMVIVDFSKDKGIPESQAIYVLSVFSLTDLIGRAGLGWVTDKNYIRRKNMVMLNLAIIGVLNLFYPLANTLTSILVIAAFHGLSVGSSITLFFVLQAEYMGMKKLPLAIGMTSFVNGAFTFFRPTMTGLFRDEIGSYNWMFHSLGIITLIVAAVWLAEPFLNKRGKGVDESVFSSRITDARKNSC